MPDPKKPNADAPANDGDPNLDPSLQTHPGADGDPSDPNPADTDPNGDPNDDGGPGPDTPPDDDGGVTDSFRKLGLGNRYANPVVALASIPEKDREIERLRRERDKALDLANTALTSRPAAPKEEPKPFDAQAFRDKFDEDPLGAFEEAAGRLGYVKKTEVEPKLQKIEGVLSKNEQEIADKNLVVAVGLHPELKNIHQMFENGVNEPPAGINPLWDEMTRIINTSPAYGAAIDRGRGFEVINDLVVLAKARLAKRKDAPVPPVSAGTKGNARTTPGARHPGASALPDYSKMTAEQIFNDQRKRGLVR